MDDDSSKTISRLTAVIQATPTGSIGGQSTDANHPSDRVVEFLTAVGHELRIPTNTAALRRISWEEHQGDVSAENLPSRVNEFVCFACTTMHIRADVLRMDFSQALACVRPGAPMGLFWLTEQVDLQWLLLTDVRGRKARGIRSNDPSNPKWESIADLTAEIANSLPTQVDWIALQSALSYAPTPDGHSDHSSPWSRFLRLVAPDRGDIGVIVIFALLVGLLTLSTPIAVETLVNTVAFGQFLQPVIVLSSMLLVLLAMAAAMRGLQIYVAEIIQRRMFVRIAGDLAVRLPRVLNSYWRNHYGPELINRFFEVVTVQKVTSQLLLDGTALVLQALVGMAVIAFYHPILLGFDAVLLLLIALVIWILGRGAVDTSIAESRQKYATAAWLEELARHPLAFRSTGGMKFAMDHADRFVTSYLLSRTSHFSVLFRQMIAALTLQVFASTVLLGLGGWLVIRGELTLGQLVAAELIVTVIVGSFSKIAKYLESFYDLMASVDKLGHLFDMPLEQSDGIPLARREAGMHVAAHDLTTQPLENGQAIHNCSFQVAEGGRIAIIGQSSNLRRSLLEAVGGLQSPASGHVELDHVDTRRLLPSSIQDQIAVISEPEIFTGTIAENIHVGRSSVSELDIRSALQSVGLLDELLDLPKGLSTQIATDGRQFANDQLLRLMLARAIAAKPRLLLVDNAFDHLSDREVLFVLEGVFQALPHCTCIISTGRDVIAKACRQHIDVDITGNVRT